VATKTEDPKRKVAVAAANSKGDGTPDEAAPSEQLSAEREFASLSRRLWLRNALLATGASVAVPSVLVFSLQSAFAQQGEGGYPNPAPSPAPSPEITPTPAPGPAREPMPSVPDDLKDAVASSTSPLTPFPSQNPPQSPAAPLDNPPAGNDKNTSEALKSASGRGANALGATTLEKSSDELQKVFDKSGHLEDTAQTPVVNLSSGPARPGAPAQPAGAQQQPASAPTQPAAPAASGTSFLTPEELARQKQAIQNYLKSGSGNVSPPLKPSPPPPPPGVSTAPKQPAPAQPAKAPQLPGLPGASPPQPAPAAPSTPAPPPAQPQS
jgi:hypothetical protein